jgi:hypothetical protein
MWWRKIFGIWRRKWGFSFIRAASLHLVLTLFDQRSTSLRNRIEIDLQNLVPRFMIA